MANQKHVEATIGLMLMAKRIVELNLQRRLHIWYLRISIQLQKYFLALRREKNVYPKRRNQQLIAAQIEENTQNYAKTDQVGINQIRRFRNTGQIYYK